MVSMFNILYRESVLYCCMEISVLYGVVPTVGSGEVLAFVLRIGGAIAKTKLCDVLVIVSRTSFANQMQVYPGLVKSALQST